MIDKDNKHLMGFSTKCFLCAQDCIEKTAYNVRLAKFKKSNNTEGLAIKEETFFEIEHPIKAETALYPVCTIVICVPCWEQNAPDFLQFKQEDVFNEQERNRRINTGRLVKAGP